MKDLNKPGFSHSKRLHFALVLSLSFVALSGCTRKLDEYFRKLPAAPILEPTRYVSFERSGQTLSEPQESGRIVIKLSAQLDF